MKPFTFECLKCGNKIKILKSLKDIFLVKSGKIIECEKCASRYQVPSLYSKIFSFYNYLLIGGLLPIILILIAVFLDNILGKTIANQLGIFEWFLAFLVYLIIELLLIVVLPLKQLNRGGEK